MHRYRTLTHELVDYIPNNLKEGVLYISMPYATVVHKCCCGCGEEVVTPLSPTDWSLIFDGRTISLYPSIGNWSFDCQSHYWITNNKVKWAEKWSKKQIDAARSYDSLKRNRYFNEHENNLGETQSYEVKDGNVIVTIFKKLKEWFSS